MPTRKGETPKRGAGGEKPLRQGRPSSFTQAKADEICRRLEGGMSLRAICQADDMPERHTVFRWLDANENFRSQYAHARERQADALFDEILDIADQARMGEIVTTKADGGVETKRADMIERARLQIDARKWIAGKLRPKVYGERKPQDDAPSDRSDLLKQLADGLPD